MSNRTRNIALATLMLASAGWGYQITGAVGAATATRGEVWSFDMWCLEMRLYPTQRCDARRPQDVKDYEFYRAEVEKFDQTRATQAERDRQIQQKLNPDSTPAKSAGPVR